MVGGLADSEKVERAFEEAHDLRNRLREQLAQLRTEVGLFLRLMYKNKNQHKRTLYYQRLSEVRRNMQMLSKSGLDETLEIFTKFFTANRPDGVPSKAVKQIKFKDAIDESKALRTLLGVARLLNQSDGPIMAGSAQLVGLLGQSFFMPFALTMFSCLARFRVLLIQVLHEVVTAFNLLSTVWQREKKPLIYSLQGKSVSMPHPSQARGVMFYIGDIFIGSLQVFYHLVVLHLVHLILIDGLKSLLELQVSASFLGQTQLPAKLECRWDGAKLSVSEKKTASVPDCRRTVPDIATDLSQLWFVDDRTGVKCELQVGHQVPASIAGPTVEQQPVQSQVPLNVNQVSQVEALTSPGTILEVQPNTCKPDPKNDIAGPSTDDLTLAEDTGGRVDTFNLAAEPPAAAPLIQCRVTYSKEPSEPTGRGQFCSSNSDSRYNPRTTSAAKQSVAYRSISQKIGLGSRCPDSSKLQVGAKRKAADIDIDRRAKSPAKAEDKKSCADGKSRAPEGAVKEKTSNDIFAMLLGGCDER